jgi:hypothetical protein
MDRRWHSNVLDVQLFRGDDCDTNYSLAVIEFRERLEVST